jgi:predicted  nucleic acid-binding Zn-ribbon protein
MLEQLTDVQAHDLELDNLHEEKGQTPPELTSLQEQKDTLQRKLLKTQQEHDGLRHQVRQNELELEALEARRKAAVASALRAGSSKEATQYQNQELQFATRVQELEEDTLPLMEQLEQLADEVTGLENELSELVPKLDELSDQENARLADIEERIQTVMSQRNAIAATIEKPLLKQYEQVRRARRGLGLVLVVKNQRCGGCNVKLPIHVVQKALKGKGITRCPSCGRILWAKQS